MKAKKIEWKDSESRYGSGIDGMCGPRKLFGITYNSARLKGSDKDDSYVLSTTLPLAIKSELRISNDREKLKELAQKIIDKFVDEIT